MAFNSVVSVMVVANRSAELWQRIACLEERISSDEMLDLAVCFPLQQIGRWIIHVWTCLCFSPHPSSAAATSYYYHDDYYASDRD